MFLSSRLGNGSSVSQDLLIPIQRNPSTKIKQTKTIYSSLSISLAGTFRRNQICLHKRKSKLVYFVYFSIISVPRALSPSLSYFNYWLINWNLKVSTHVRHIVNLSEKNTCSAIVHEKLNKSPWDTTQTTWRKKHCRKN